jgi:FKBP-type peptidyl-prolyl cis-trans isomerase
LNRKELREKKKAAKKAAAEATARAAADPQMSRAEMRAERSRIAKERKRAERKEQERQFLRERRREKKVRKQKQLRREMNAPGGAKGRAQKLLGLKRSGGGGASSDTKKDKRAIGGDSREIDVGAVFDRVFNGGTVDKTTGATTLEMGVQCIDIVTGAAGSMTAEEGMLANVRYRLTGGGTNPAVIDSSKSFNFRLGRGEVIRGWDIGVLGMRVGGRRRLIIPPKAGYGGQDIGAGPGAVLYFDITLLSCRAR